MISKTCKHHGELSQEDIGIKIDRRYGNVRETYVCKICRKKRDNAYYEANRERRNECSREYYNKNPHKKSYAIRKKYHQRVPEKTKTWARNQQVKERETLHDTYIRKLISRDGKILYKDIPDELVKLKRNIYILKKTIKELEEKK